ncbi:MAG: enoyl-CoA hydratase [Micromonosporaceae bacterium]
MIESETSDRVTLLRIDRQEQRNALDTSHCEQLRAAIDTAVDSGARCLVLTGVGSAFCAGADLNQVYGESFIAALYGLLRRITEVEVPVVAAINGPAIGAGTQLAVACDLRVTAPAAVFGVPTAKLGLAVDPWTVRRVALLAGAGPARRMLLACETLDVAAAPGLSDRHGDLDTALAWAAEIAALAPLTLAYNKMAVNTLLEPELPAATETRLGEGFQACWASEDFQEAMRARAEQRPPHFTGR